MPATITMFCQSCHAFADRRSPFISKHLPPMSFDAAATVAISPRRHAMMRVYIFAALRFSAAVAPCHAP